MEELLNDANMISGQRRHTTSFETSSTQPNATAQPNLETYIYLYINDIFNLDYLSNLYTFQFSMIEVWRNANVTLSILDSNDRNRPILLENTSYIEQLYPNLRIDEADLNAGAGHQRSASSRDAFKHYYYIPNGSILIKSSKVIQQTRCRFSMQNYPFIYQPCRLSFRTSHRQRHEINYTICNLNKFINKQFDFNKVSAIFGVARIVLVQFQSN